MMKKEELLKNEQGYAVVFEAASMIVRAADAVASNTKPPTRVYKVELDEVSYGLFYDVDKNAFGIMRMDLATLSEEEKSEEFMQHLCNAVVTQNMRDQIEFAQGVNFGKPSQEEPCES